MSKFCILPPNVAAIAKAAAKDEGKYAMRTIRLRRTEEGYRAEATDGKLLAIVEGKQEVNYEDFALPVEGFEQALSEATEVLVPAGTFEKAVKPTAAGLKAARRGGMNRSKDKTAVAMSKKTAVFAGHDGVASRMTTLPVEEGKFPPTQDVIPKKKPKRSFVVDPKFLVKLLQIAGTYGDRVTIELHEDGKPVILRSENESQRFTGLIVPLA